MHNFIPEPESSSDDWASAEVINILSPEGYNNLSSSDNWICYGVYSSEMFAPSRGYPVVFYNATDCLLWLRWWVLPSAYLASNKQDIYGIHGKEINLNGEYAEIAEQIDGCPDGTDAAEFLNEYGSIIADQLSQNDRFEIGTPYSFYQWMSNEGSVEDWKEALNDPSISCKQGIWNLSTLAWEKIDQLYFNT